MIHRLYLREKKVMNKISVNDILNELKKCNIEFLFLGNENLEIVGFSNSRRVRSNTVIMFENIMQISIIGEKEVLLVSAQEIEKKSNVSLLVVKDKEVVFKKIVTEILNTEKEKAMTKDEIIKRFPNADLKLGDNVKIEEGVSMYGCIELGDNVVIRSGAVIGQEGYEFVSDKNGDRWRLPSQGKVVIGNNVDIGANVCVDCGIIGDTIIRDNVKIANLCQVAHDVIIGRDTMMATKASISAYTEIGEKCFISAGATIKDNIKIGEETFVGMGSVVKDTIPGKFTVFGNPAVKYQRKKELLTINKINKSYKTTDEKTLENISFDIASNEFLSILGPSGCGKSTLLKIMAGLLDADSGGMITVKNEKLNIDMVFQEDTLMPWFNVEKNVGLGLEIKKVKKEIRKEKVAWALKIVGLEGYEKYYPHQLSGGMKKRVAIARCLVLNSDLLLMDEPFSALDSITKRKIQDDLLKLQKEQKFSVCMVTHDVEEAVALSDRIIVVAGKPAKIKTIVPVYLQNRENRSSDEFINIKNSIIDIIKEA